ncbi:MAG: MFS transporter [Chloroflexi bacterium]|nr:MFS transporter [Chloroflexota bacterium]
MGSGRTTIWRNARFLLLWLTNLVSVAGTGASALAVSWWVLRETGSAAVMAGAGAVQVVVMALLAAPAGVVADRVDRRRYLVGLETARGLVMVVLAGTLLGGHAPVPWVYFLLMLDAAGLALFNPTISAVWPQVVPAEQLPQANSLIWTTQNLGRVVGPAVGGWLAASWGAWSAAAVDAFSYGVSALGLVLVGSLALPGVALAAGGRRDGGGAAAREAGGGGAEAQPPSAAEGGRRPGFLEDLVEGLRWTAGRRELVSLLVVASMLNLAFSGAFVLLPVLVERVFHAGPQALGWLEAGFSGGALAGGLLLSLLKVRPVGWRVAAALLVQTALMGFVGWSAHVALNVGLLFGMGLVNALINVAVTTLLQWMVPQSMMGRVFGLLSTVATALTPLGQVLAGFLGDRVAIPWIFSGAAILSVLVGLLAVARAPELLHMERWAPRAGAQQAGEPASS